MENVKTGPFRKLKYQLNLAAQYLKLKDRGIFFSIYLLYRRNHEAKVC